MNIVDEDAPFRRAVPPGESPPYDIDNPVLRVIDLVEKTELAAEREHYLADSLQHLIPFSECGLYGPSGADWQTLDPRFQDNKNDFQKQNVHSFKAGDMRISRGYACAGGWIGAFVKLSYNASPFTALGGATGGFPGSSLKLFVKIGNAATPEPVSVSFDPVGQCYSVELWSFGGGDKSLRALLGTKGRKSLDEGLIQLRPDLVKGSLGDFTGPEFDDARNAAIRAGSGLGLIHRSPEHAMHPIRPLRVEMAWADETFSVWDSRNGANHVYEFGMILRGWNNYFQVGQSKNPHGGVGVLEFRNLMSNYFTYEKERREIEGAAWEPELGRELDVWNFDANTWRPAEEPPVGEKPKSAKRETFMTVDYMDLHILQPSCGIGIHRHRDNQEVFMLLEGKGLMIIGDWCRMARRERAFEVRTMLPGDLTLCKTGQLHALYNLLDEPASLFMFGGYD